MSIREQINELDIEVLLLEPASFDAAIIGLVDIPGGATAVCYDTEKVLEVLMTGDGMDRDAAEEFFSFNIKGAYMGAATPLFLDRLSS